jgi:hypothetical protein
MRRTMLAVAAVAVSGALAQVALAQQSSPPAPPEKSATDDAGRTTPRPSIKVLQHPYDISSFYRLGESSLGPWAGLPNDPSYRIAGFYRAHEGGYPSSPYGWSAFWTNGYSAPRPAPFPGYRRTIGENGDLFLMVPFLAPVGPISSAFFGY